MLILLTVWVDDLLVATPDEDTSNALGHELQARFSMRNLGRLRWFLGMEIKYSDSGITVTQVQYINNILQTYGMNAAKTTTTPMEVNTTLIANADDNDRRFMADKPYRELVGSLLYLSMCTRPDIAEAVGQLARHAKDPTQAHWVAAKRILRYLKGTLELGLHYHRHPETARNTITGYADANWGTNPDLRRSTSGYVFLLNGAAISWFSKLQSSVALSSAEAEYMAVCAAAQEATHLRMLMHEIHYEQAEPTIIYEDNQACIHSIDNPVTSKLTKHIAIRYHFVRDLVLARVIKMVYLPTTSMVADALTKPVSADNYRKHRTKMLGCTVEAEC